MCRPSRSSLGAPADGGTLLPENVMVLLMDVDGTDWMGESIILDLPAVGGMLLPGCDRADHGGGGNCDESSMTMLIEGSMAESLILFSYDVSAL